MSEPSAGLPSKLFYRIGEVADIARGYLYCMEQEFGTGIVLTVDGGTVLV